MVVLFSLLCLKELNLLTHFTVVNLPEQGHGIWNVTPPIQNMCVFSWAIELFFCLRKAVYILFHFFNIEFEELETASDPKVYACRWLKFIVKPISSKDLVSSKANPHGRGQKLTPVIFLLALSF